MAHHHPVQSYQDYVTYNAMYDRAVSEGTLNPMHSSNQYPSLYIDTSSSDSSKRSSLEANSPHFQQPQSQNGIFPQYSLSPISPHYPQLSLKNSLHWQELHAIGNEMLTKYKGKFMNPPLGYDFTGLSETSSYCIGIKLSLQNPNKLEYKNGKWNEIVSYHKVVDSPKEVLSKTRRGDDIMRHGFVLDKLQMCSECTRPSCKWVNTGNMLPVVTFHSYLPLMTLYEVLPNNHMKKIFSEVSFQETQFIVVTDYKSDELKKVKVKPK